MKFFLFCFVFLLLCSSTTWSLKLRNQTVLGDKKFYYLHKSEDNNSGLLQELFFR